MAIERWTPFRDLRRFERTHRHFGVPYHYPYAGGWAIPLDVERDGDDFVVKGTLPGVAPSDIDVTIEDGVLTIEGRTASEGEHEEGGYLLRERRTGSFRRSVRLPESVDVEHAASSYEHGVVTVRLPKAESSKAKRLTLHVTDEAPAPDPAPAA